MLIIQHAMGQRPTELGPLARLADLHSFRDRIFFEGPLIWCTPIWGVTSIAGNHVEARLDALVEKPPIGHL